MQQIRSYFNLLIYIYIIIHYVGSVVTGNFDSIFSEEFMELHSDVDRKITEVVV